MIWHQGKVYVIGGFDGNQCFNSMRCFDPVTHLWEEKGCMYVQRCYVSVAAVGSSCTPSEGTTDTGATSLVKSTIQSRTSGALLPTCTTYAVTPAQIP
ncbi:hypothetical protein CEXT_283751 [Caerostris extrusa]|uniref:Uncharacterized protein n=1 Tax=Caerostris extrusa TaxID=172846 RepID=A0AAV4NMK6_CAEEX|nr:hypothetical protein CEXT_283751 [Caerostris extrusa]